MFATAYIQANIKSQTKSFEYIHAETALSCISTAWSGFCSQLHLWPAQAVFKFVDQPGLTMF